MRTAIGAVRAPRRCRLTGPALAARTRTAPSGAAADAIAFWQARTTAVGVPGIALDSGGYPTSPRLVLSRRAPDGRRMRGKIIEPRTPLAGRMTVVPIPPVPADPDPAAERLASDLEPALVPPLSTVRPAAAASRCTAAAAAASRCTAADATSAYRCTAAGATGAYRCTAADAAAPADAPPLTPPIPPTPAPTPAETPLEPTLAPALTPTPPALPLTPTSRAEAGPIATAIDNVAAMYLRIIIVLLRAMRSHGNTLRRPSRRRPEESRRQALRFLFIIIFLLRRAIRATETSLSVCATELAAGQRAAKSRAAMTCGPPLSEFPATPIYGLAERHQGQMLLRGDLHSWCRVPSMQAGGAGKDA